jgi:hypothetical protein
LTGKVENTFVRVARLPPGRFRPTFSFESDRGTSREQPALTDRIDPSVEFRMETIRLADLDVHSIAASPLDDRLLLLNSDSDDLPSVAESAETADPSPEFVSWKDRFASNRDQITRRLAVIEAELDRLETPGAGPKLGVYGSGH